MKRIFFLLLTVTLALFALTACFGTVNHQYTSDCDPFCDCCPFPVERETTVEHTRETCDAKVCSTCSTEIEPIAHTYSDKCDPTCDVCGVVRTELEHTYSGACGAICTVCGDVRTGVTHTYTDNCDASCNVCGETRSELPHAWLHACSGICSNCGATRVTEHSYEFACSVACSTCGETRTVAANVHSFAYGCGNLCSVCGFERIGDFHNYSNACDTICDNTGCGFERAEQHVWEGYCNARECITCGATSSIAHVDGDGDYICDVCGALCDHICVNEESADCDRPCTICGEPVGEHTYSFACDLDCDVEGCTTGDRVVGENEGDAKAHSTKAACGTVCQYCGEDIELVGEPAQHTYDGECDSECNLCGEKREPTVNHTASETEGCEICEVCGEATGFAHQYNKACDEACSVCGFANPNAGHVGNYTCSESCKYCGAQLDSIQHSFNADCAMHCSNCGEHVRTDAAAPHTDDDGDKICDVCAEELPVSGDGVLPEHTIPAKKNDE